VLFWWALLGFSKLAFFKKTVEFFWVVFFTTTLVGTQKYDLSSKCSYSLSYHICKLYRWKSNL